MFYLRVEACAEAEETRTYFLIVCLRIETETGEGTLLPSGVLQLLRVTRSVRQEPPTKSHSQLEATCSTCPWNSLGRKQQLHMQSLWNLEALNSSEFPVHISSETEE